MRFETHLLYYIGIYQEDRNFIVHGSWGTLAPDNVPICTSLRPKSPTPGEVIAETFTEERMLNLINGINEAITGIKILMTGSVRIAIAVLRPTLDRRASPTGILIAALSALEQYFSR
jgi:hypothetical protein